MPEGDTIHRTANRLRPVLEGQPVVRFEAPRLTGDTAQTRRRDRSGRGRGQEPAGEVPSPAGVAHPHEDDRIVAHLSHPGEVARTRPSRPRGHRGARLGRRLFRGADRAHMARHSPANRTRCLIWAPTCACPTSTSTSLSNGWRISPKLARR